MFYYNNYNNNILFHIALRPKKSCGTSQLMLLKYAIRKILTEGNILK